MDNNSKAHANRAMEGQRYRYFVKMGYLGSEHHGWQVQENSKSIQGDTEDAFSILLGEKIRLTGAGRTDTGVHAREFYAHFDASIDPELLQKMELVYKVNRILPHTIAIYGIHTVSPRAHARFDATDRTYHYIICTRKDPFYHGRAWIFERPLDISKMQDASDLLLKNDDFGSFARSNTQVKTNICSVYEAKWDKQEHLLVFRIKADRFLRNMVRSIVGTLVDTGLGKLSTNDFSRIIEARDRRRAGYSAPACGLYLMKISYPQGLLTSSYRP